MTLNQDFKEFIASLNASGARYLVVGGYAVAFYGHPRYTKDLDVWLEVSADNADRIVKALERFGFGGLQLSAADFSAEGHTVQLGYPPHRIDLLMSLTGVSFADCFRVKQVLNLDGVLINFIDLENLRRNKRAIGRHQDLADLENLEEKARDP